MENISDEQLENAESSIEDQPSTSSGPAETTVDETFHSKEEMETLLKATNEMLESKAKSMNLSSLNVRSILHHLIKYPSTIDVLLGIRETDDIPTVRNTRSRKKPGENGSVPSSATQTPKKFALRIEDKGPKSFLDLEYQEDDEFDEDYVEEDGKLPKEDGETGEEDDEENDDEEEEEGEEEEEEEEVEEQKIPEDHVRVVEETKPLGCDLRAESSMALNDTSLDHIFFGGDNDNLEFKHDKSTNMSMTLNETMPRSESAAPVPTLDLGDDEYRDFVMSIKCPNEVRHVSDFSEQIQYDTDDDEDYNVIAEGNLDVDDWYETRQDKTTMIPRHEVKALMMDTLLAEKEIPINAFPDEAIILEEEEFARLQRRKEEMERQSFAHYIPPVPSESCSLIHDREVTFRQTEILQLQMQMEQHVQLLMQFVVTCHFDEDVSHVRNEAQLMMNDLDNIRKTKTGNTMFDVANLGEAFHSCYDINEFEKADEDIVQWNTVADRYQGHILRPEAAAVLSRSHAIMYPELLIPFQPSMQSNNLSFLPSENLMLAMALLQFAQLPRKPEKGLPDRYTTIHNNCLPARSSYKIRTHLKTMRRLTSPIHKIIQAAEKGVCKLVMPEKNWQMIDGPISGWPEDMQPDWYKLFLKRLVIVDEKRVCRKSDARRTMEDARRLIITPTKKTAPQVRPEGAGDVAEGDEEFVKLGDGPGGQEVVMRQDQIQEMLLELIKNNTISPSKRRKNSSPQKLYIPAEYPMDDSEPSTSSSRKPSVKTSSRKSSSRNLANLAKAKLPDVPAASESADTSFENPPTPGRNPPEEPDPDFMDLESNSLMWTRISNPTVTTGNPRTPRGFVTSSDEPTDFSGLLGPDPYSPSSDAGDYFYSECQAPMGMSSRRGAATEYVMDEFSNDSQVHYSCESTSSNSGVPPVTETTTPSDHMEEDSMTGLDMVPRDLDLEDLDEDEYEEVDDVPSTSEAGGVGGRLRRNSDQKSRKRTRAQREEMGSVGLANEELYQQQKTAVVRKTIEDVKQKLFMHLETWKRLSKTMTAEHMSDSEKVHRTILILSNYPELLNLVLLYAPPDSIPPDHQADLMFQSYKIAIDMILDIERYVKAAKIKEPSIRGIFRYIISFLEKEPDLSGEQASQKFFQLLGQDRPLWKKLEKHFYCLAHRTRPEKVEHYELVDLSQPEQIPTKKERREKNNIPAHFEVVEDIDLAISSSIRPARYDEKPLLVVKCGELCLRTEQEDEYIQLEVTERQWTRKDDITLLTRYNEAVRKNLSFDEHDTPTLVPELHFGAKSIVARLRYLLAELRTH